MNSHQGLSSLHPLCTTADTAKVVSSNFLVHPPCPIFPCKPAKPGKKNSENDVPTNLPILHTRGCNNKKLRLSTQVHDKGKNLLDLQQQKKKKHSGSPFCALIKLAQMESFGWMDIEKLWFLEAPDQNCTRILCFHTAIGRILDNLSGLPHGMVQKPSGRLFRPDSTCMLNATWRFKSAFG